MRLQTCSWAASLFSLCAALQDIVGPTYRDVMGAATGGGPGFSRDEAVRVMRALHASKHGAVLRRRLVGLVGVDVVNAMVRANLLALRPGYSRLAHDVPREAWQGAETDDLATAATAMHLYAIRHIVNSGVMGPPDTDKVRSGGGLRRSLCRAVTARHMRRLHFCRCACLVCLPRCPGRSGYMHHALLLTTVCVVLLRGACCVQAPAA